MFQLINHIASPRLNICQSLISFLQLQKSVWYIFDHRLSLKVPTHGYFSINQS
jgi:hypothetical protein